MKIYKLTCKKTKHIYIGSSSKQYLSQSLQSLEYSFNTWINRGIFYCIAFDIIKMGDYSIELLEECKTEEYRQRLQHHIDLNQGCINKRRAYMKNILINRQTYDNKYREKNKEAISLRRKELYKMRKHLSNPVLV